MVPSSRIDPLGFARSTCFCDWTVCGFAGVVERAWDAVDSAHAFMGANGGDEPLLTEQLEGWIDGVNRRGDEFAQPDEWRTELLLIRARFGTTEGGRRSRARPRPRRRRGGRSRRRRLGRGSPRYAESASVETRTALIEGTTIAA
jgi:hypothetical protein